jgi:poly(hydroxyalkanoate) depolymerase family esterase
MLHALAYNDHDGTIEIDGRTRNHFVHTPPGYTGKTPLPLVLVLHGATESANKVERLSGMSAKADQQNFLAVYPTGTGRLKNVPTWNSGACCGHAMEHKIDDVAFLRALLERVEKDYSVDPKRIYATGISNGGMMSYRLACELSDKFAAISPVEGAQDIPCHPTSPVSVIVFHGTTDHLVPFNGGSTPISNGLGPFRHVRRRHRGILGGLRCLRAHAEARSNRRSSHRPVLGLPRQHRRRPLRDPRRPSHVARHRAKQQRRPSHRPDVDLFQRPSETIMRVPADRPARARGIGSLRARCLSPFAFINAFICVHLRSSVMNSNCPHMR